MITEKQLYAVLRKAGDELEVPGDGPARVLAATTRDDPAPVPAVAREPVPRPRPTHPRRLVLAGAAAIVVLAAIGLTIGLLSSSTPPINHVAGPVSTAPRSFGVASPATGAPSAGLTLPTANGAAKSSAPSGPTTVRGAPTSGVPAKVAYTGHLTLAIAGGALAKDVDALRQLASRTGGYVAASDVNDSAASRGGTMSLAIPADAFDHALVSAEGLGSVASVVTKATDLTTQYSDTTAEIQALTAVRTQLETLLSRAAKVSDLLAVEEQIQNVETQIDELQSTERSLGNEVTYATLAVNLDVATTKHRATAASSLSRAWHDAVTGFTGGLRWLLSISGALLFALLVAVALVLGLRAFVRRGLPRLRRLFL